MKRLNRVIIACALTGLSIPSYGLVNLGEGGQITLSASTSVFRDSSIRARNSDQEDTIFTIGSTLRYTRPSRLFDLSASVGLTVVRYDEFDEFDDENVSLNLNFSPTQSTEIRASSVTISGDLILESTTEADEELGEIVSKRTYGLALGLLYDPNSHYNLRLRGSATRQDPDSSRFNEIEQKSFGATLEIPVNASTLLEFGGSYSDTDSDRNQNTRGDTITGYAGLNGRILPKVSGSIRGGLQRQDTDGLGSETSPYASAGLTWTIDESTSGSLNLSHSLGSTLDDRRSETTSATFRLSRTLNRRLSANASLRFSDSQISGVGVGTRDTDSTGLSGGVTYIINDWASLSGTISYSDSNSNDSDFDFDRWRSGVTVRASW